MTRILWNLCPSYWGLSQLITILKDLPLAAVKANSRTLNSVERANSPWRSRDPLFRFVKAKSTSRAIVLARPGRLQDFLEATKNNSAYLRGDRNTSTARRSMVQRATYRMTDPGRG